MFFSFKDDRNKKSISQNQLFNMKVRENKNIFFFMDKSVGIFKIIFSSFQDKTNVYIFSP